jgi:PilZ domain
VIEKVPDSTTACEQAAPAPSLLEVSCMGMTSRRFPRVPLNVQAKIVLDGRLMPCRLLQLGLGGALVEVAPHVEVPELFTVSFQLPSTITMTVLAEPRYRRERGGYRPNPSVPTVGCEFRQLPEWGSRAISTFVTQQREAVRQLQFSLALMPPSPKAKELMQKVGVSELPMTELKQFVRWCTSGN